MAKREALSQGGIGGAGSETSADGEMRTTASAEILSKRKILTPRRPRFPSQNRRTLDEQLGQFGNPFAAPAPPPPSGIFNQPITPSASFGGFQTPPQPQNNTSNSFPPAQQQQSQSNIFGGGNSGFNFGAFGGAPTNGASNQAAANPFAGMFTNNNAPAPQESTNFFANTQFKPSNTVGTFGSTNTAPSQNTPPTNNIFSNNPFQPNHLSNGFASPAPPATPQPSTNLFNSGSQQNPSSANIFASSASKPFASESMPKPSQTTANVMGGDKPSTPDALHQNSTPQNSIKPQNLFGGSTTPSSANIFSNTQTSTNLFGMGMKTPSAAESSTPANPFAIATPKSTIQPTAASTTNLFGASVNKTQASTPTFAFGNESKSSEPSAFGSSPKAAAQPTSTQDAKPSLFNNLPPATPGNIFADSAPKLFATPATKPPTTAAPNLFSTSTAPASEPTKNAAPVFSFGNAAATPAKIFADSGPNLFATPAAKEPTPKPILAKVTETPAKIFSDGGNNIFATPAPVAPKPSATLSQTSSQLFTAVPQASATHMRPQASKQARIRDLNSGFTKAVEHIFASDPAADMTSLCDAYKSQLAKITGDVPDAKRGRDEESSTGTEKRPRLTEPLPAPPVPATPAKAPMPTTTGSATSKLFQSVIGGAPSPSSPSKSNGSSSFQAPAAASESKPVDNPFAIAKPLQTPTSKESSTIAPQTEGPKALPPLFTPKVGTTSQTPQSVPSLFAPKSGLASGGGNTSMFAPSFPSTSGVAGSLAQQAEANLAKLRAEAKQRAKDEDWDEDDETEAEWEARYDEEQKKKQAEIQSKASSAPVFKFSSPQASTADKPTVSNSLFGAPPSSASTTTPSKPLFGFTNSTNTATASANKPLTSSGGTSIFKSGATPSTTSNLFGNLTKTPQQADDPDSDHSEAENGSPKERTKRRRDEDAENVNGDDQTTPAAKRVERSNDSTGKSLFDRISPAADKNSSEDPNSSPLTGDHTWKKDSPIKFSGAASNGTSTLFGTPSEKTGGANGLSKTPAPAVNLFGSPNPNPTPSLFGKTMNSSSGFSFGGAKTNGLAPPATNSLFKTTSEASTTDHSREVSPAISTGTAGDSDGEAVKPDPQTHLTSMTPEELKDWEVVFEEDFTRYSRLNSERKWEKRGSGPFRVLKGKSDGKQRILVRQAPSGRVVINTTTIVGTKQPQAGKLLMTIIEGDGKPATWLATMDKERSGEALKVLEK